MKNFNPNRWCNLRSGSWYNDLADSFLTYRRLWHPPDDRDELQGFRCVTPVTLGYRLVKLDD